MCDSGYLATGPMEVQCSVNQSTGFQAPYWKNLTDHFCTDCGDPHPVPNGAWLQGPRTVGSRAEYSCNPGYLPTGPSLSVCQNNGAWAEPGFVCRGCGQPPMIPNAQVVSRGLITDTVGSVVSYECVPGFEPSSSLEITCSDTAEWTQPTFQCLRSCVEPPMYDDARVEQTLGGTYAGSVLRYVCNEGYLTVGDSSVTCLETGVWSDRRFDCANCSPAPQLENAIPIHGSGTIGSETFYACADGFRSDGDVISVCQSDLTWSVPAFECYDCGNPPEVMNAYSRFGPTTIGSIRQYSCEAGYEMSGRDTVECLPSGSWSEPRFVCNVKTTTTTTTPAPLENDPSVCDGCRMLNGVGYNQHPYDCTMYVQCFFSPRGGIEAIYRPCPFGLYWDQNVLTCRPSQQVECPHERCVIPSLTAYRHTDNTKCSAYWECDVNRKSVARCCSAGYRFESGSGCVPDPSCTTQCPHQDILPACDKRPLLDVTRYEQHIGNGYWVKMPCAAGTAFNIIDCQCSLLTGIIPGHVCLPEILLNFDDGRVSDQSGRNVFVYNDGVRAYDGAAYFSGNSRLVINRFSNTEFRGHLVIKFRYKELFMNPSARGLQALVTNGDCGDDPSIMIAKMPGYVILGCKTDAPKSFALPTVDKEWKEVVYIHDERKLEGRVCGASYNKWSYGPVQATHCGLQIGHGSRLANFTGLMDDISLYQCRPADDVLSVYGRHSKREQPVPTERPRLPTAAPEVPTTQRPVTTTTPHSVTEKTTVKPVPTAAPEITTKRPITERPAVKNVVPELKTERPALPTIVPKMFTESPALPTIVPDIITEKPAVPTTKPDTKKETVAPTDAPSTPKTEPVTVTIQQIEITTKTPAAPMDESEISKEIPMPTESPKTPTDKPFVPTEIPFMPPPPSIRVHK